MTQRDTPELLSFISAGIDGLFRNPTSPFLTTTAENLLWEGFDVDCNVKDFSAKALCAALRAEGPVKQVTEKELKVALLNMRNDADVGRFTVLRGKKNKKDMNQMVAQDGSDRIKVYDVDECNLVEGSEGSFYAAPVKKTSELESFIPELCRRIHFNPIGSKTVLGVDTLMFGLNLTNVS